MITMNPYSNMTQAEGLPCELKLYTYISHKKTVQRTETIQFHPRAPLESSPGQQTKSISQKQNHPTIRRDGTWGSYPCPPTPPSTQPTLQTRPARLSHPQTTTCRSQQNPACAKSEVVNSPTPYFGFFPFLTRTRGGKAGLGGERGELEGVGGKGRKEKEGKAKVPYHVLATQTRAPGQRGLDPDAVLMSVREWDPRGEGEGGFWRRERRGGWAGRTGWRCVHPTPPSSFSPLTPTSSLPLYLPPSTPVYREENHFCAR